MEKEKPWLCLWYFARGKWERKKGVLKMYEYGRDFTAETLTDFFEKIRNKDGKQDEWVKAERFLSEEEKEGQDTDFI